MERIPLITGFKPWAASLAGQNLIQGARDHVQGDWDINTSNQCQSYSELGQYPIHFNPTALRKAKIAYNFGLSECSRVKKSFSILVGKKMLQKSYLGIIK